MEAMAALTVGAPATTAAVSSTAIAAGTFAPLGAAAVTAPTVGLFGVGGSLTAAGALSGASTIFSAMTSIGASQQMSSLMQQDAAMMDYRAKDEELSGRLEAARIRMMLAEDIAAANARGGAGSIDITTGSPAHTVEAGTRRSRREETLAEAGGRGRASMTRGRARMTRQDARAVRSGGYMKAAGSILDFATERVDQMGAF